MKTILIATHNKAKLDEINRGLKSFLKNHINIVSLFDVKVSVAPDEKGQTFEENARLKAKFYGNLSGLPTIADDGGLIIPYLNNEPGVKSRRWPGYEASDRELINYTLAHLGGVQKKDRLAFLQTCLCFYDPKTRKTFCEEEKIAGFIAEKPLDIPTYGYPFRALFIVKKYNKYYDELTSSEHEKENHRLKALKRLVKRIREYLIE
ncbi:hypothetical protein HY357_00130 [Candidatus Roizmanbacteria bacterium]|nr:hypothetical protein [Candidatus Roizmanbacteria bacterium]